MDAPDYKLTIRPQPSGGYSGRLESSEGDLWAEIRQAPQEGEQFKASLEAFADRFGIPVEVAAEA
jgi:hypothetical protein